MGDSQGWHRPPKAAGHAVLLPCRCHAHPTSSAHQPRTRGRLQVLDGLPPKTPYMGQIPHSCWSSHASSTHLRVAARRPRHTKRSISQGGGVATRGLDLSGSPGLMRLPAWLTYKCPTSQPGHWHWIAALSERLQPVSSFRPGLQRQHLSSATARLPAQLASCCNMNGAD